MSHTRYHYILFLGVGFGIYCPNTGESSRKENGKGQEGGVLGLDELQSIPYIKTEKKMDMMWILLFRAWGLRV